MSRCGHQEEHCYQVDAAHVEKSYIVQLDSLLHVVVVVQRSDLFLDSRTLKVDCGFRVDKPCNCNNTCYKASSHHQSEEAAAQQRNKTLRNDCLLIVVILQHTC